MPCLCNKQMLDDYYDIYEKIFDHAKNKDEAHSEVIVNVIDFFNTQLSNILQHRGGKTFRRRRRRLSKKKRTKSKARKQ